MSSALLPQGSVSPVTSRIPSPPPFPEVQIGPKSPMPGATAGSPILDMNQITTSDFGASRRIRAGTKSADMASGPPLVPLSELDSPYQLQEHLKALYFHHTKYESNNTTMPISHETALVIATPPDGVDRSLWLYELCRFLVERVNSMITGFFADSPPCSAQNCPEMRASEWQYLCAVHDPPKSCCAIDYCCHTLDWAANVLTSQKHFPSRLSLGSEATGGSQQGVRQLTNIFRRVYRMFAHGWFQHRGVFCKVEGEEGLYVFYKTVCDVYNLIPDDNYTVPAEAEGLASETEFGRHDGLPKQSETSPDNQQSNGVDMAIEHPSQLEEGNVNTTINTGATTRRHKHTPSVGSAVTTIDEGDEEQHALPTDFQDSGSATDMTHLNERAPEDFEMSLPMPSRSLSVKHTQVGNPEPQHSPDAITSLSEDIKELAIEKPEGPIQETSTPPKPTEDGKEAEVKAEPEEEKEESTVDVSES